MRPIRGTVLAGFIAVLGGGSSLAAQELPSALPSGGFEAREVEHKFEFPSGKAKDGREHALARAQIWREPPVPLAQADLRANSDGPGAFATTDELVCKFIPQKTSGATPKFECVFEGGDVLKVKYGRNPEVHTETAASRLLLALGAGADRVYLVKRLRCFGCPADPQALLTCLSSPLDELRRQCLVPYGEAAPNGGFALRIDYSRYVDFAPVAIERRAEGKVVEADGQEGWGWEELDQLQSTSRGATRAERDALRLLAVFLNHWDNKADNQRLLCLPGPSLEEGGCRDPFAYIHDVGGTFGRVGGETKGERKLDVEGWRAVAIWEDAPACRVRVKTPALHGATFGSATISESGRLFLARRLGALTTDQVRGLFEGSRLADYEGASAASRDVEEWVKAFADKVRQITEREPCPNL